MTSTLIAMLLSAILATALAEVLDLGSKTAAAFVAVIVAGVIGLALSSCAYRPPAQVLAGEWRIDPAAADAHAASADDTADQVLGWALGLLGAGAAGAPTGAALDGLDADQRALTIVSASVALAAGGVLMWRWAALSETADEWRLVRDVVAARASPWEALRLPAGGASCTAPGCP